MMRLRRLIAAACTAAVLSGCAGSAIEPAARTPDAPQAPHRTREQKATLVIHVRVPHRRRAHYVSPATKGMRLSFSGPKTVTEVIGLTPTTDPRCSNSGGATTCRIAVDLPAGSYAANVTTYNEAPAGGSLPGNAKILSTAGGVAVNVVTGKTNQANFTLEGVPASFAVKGLPGGESNTAFDSPKPFGVDVKDAGGYIIVGSYYNAVTVSDSDTSGATTIAIAGSDKPPAGKLLSSNDTLTLNYTGLAIAPATISASATGATTGTGSFAPTLQTIGPSTLTGGVFVNAYGAGSPVSFDASETGWTNAPYSKSLTATLSAPCSSFVTVSPSHGTTFTATLVQNPSNDSCTLTLSDGAGQRLVIPLGYDRFDSTGSSQTFDVPDGVTTTIVTLAGGAGGAGGNSGPTGGQGGIVTAALTGVPNGVSFDVEVGGEGGNGTQSTPFSGTAGYNGGAIGSPDGSCGGGGGGGASDIRFGGSTLADRILVAGGGGGSACFSGGGSGGAGGSDTFGGSGANGETIGQAVGGGGGTSSMGGTAGTSCNSDNATGGGLGSGGEGATGGGTASGAGGGGGGLYGGGGGGSATVTGCTGDVSGGGGGGSSFAPAGTPGIDGLTTTQGGNAGSGYVIFVW